MTLLWGPSTHWLLFPSWLRVDLEGVSSPSLSAYVCSGVKQTSLALDKTLRQKVNRLRDILGWRRGEEDTASTAGSRSEQRCGAGMERSAMLAITFLL